MATTAPAVDDRTFRAINYRLKSTPVPQLPRILGHITTQLVSSKCDFSNSSTEATWLKTRISSLLQDRTLEGKFCGVFLAKTVLDLGGSALIIEDKDRISTWSRNLLDILKRPGLTSTKTCAVVFMTKIFMLTWENATLVRELTTPLLPTYITTCLHLFQGTPQIKTQLQCELAEFVLESFATLLPRHPTVFRSFAAQVRSLAIATLCTDPFNDASMVVVDTETKDAACRVLVLLHQCAQKGGGAVEWEKGLDELLLSTHATLDQVFRAVVEDWQSVAGVRSTISSSGELPDEPEMRANDQTGFPGWHGLQSGIECLNSCLALLQAYLCSPTATSVKLPLGRIVDLLTRLIYVQAPRTKDAVSTRYVPQIGREERDELLSQLPSIHAETIAVVNTLLDRLGDFAMPISLHFLDLLSWLFQSEQFDASVRTATYKCIARLLSMSGPALGKSTVKSLSKITQSCCRDLLPQQVIAAPSSEMINAQLTNGNKSSKNPQHNGQLSPTTRHTLPGLHSAAHALLPVLYSKLPTHLIPKATRTEMDRTAILTSHIDALAASVLNPAPGKASLLPFLSALAPGHAVTEAIVRPRMPVILSGKSEGQNVVEDNEEVDEVEVVEEEEEQDADAVEEDGDASMYQPKVIDWAAVSSIAKKGTSQPQSAISFGNLATAARTQLSKRGAEDETQTPAYENKRPRVENDDEETSPVRVAPFQPTSEPQVLSVPQTMGAVQKADESEDEDGSDFEIPPLVMRTGFEEDEDE